MKKKIIAVIGNKKIEPDGIRYRLAFETGKILVDHGYRIQSGGMGGVMEAVFAGAHASENYREGDTVALVPSFDSATANAGRQCGRRGRNRRRRGNFVRICVRLVFETPYHRLSQFGRLER